MFEAWKQWEGLVVDARFPLQKYLGGSEHSAVFLTARGEQAAKAAIKFIQVPESEAELQLARWKSAAKLSHPHLLRLFECGRCQLGEFNLLFVVSEFAEENLSQFLPQRPLTPVEARDVLEPVLKALTHLHGNELVHGHIQPSNIFAIEDQVKLSSDGISVSPGSTQAPLNEDETDATDAQAADSARLVTLTRTYSTSYDPPEAAIGPPSQAGDIWSLGMTLVEALTQRLPVLPAAYSPSTRPPDPVVPETLPALFVDIVRHCLHREPQRRWTVADIAARLNPAAPRPAQPAVPAVAPKPVPKPVAPAAPIASTPSVPPSATKSVPYVPPSVPPARHPQSALPRDHYTKPRYDIAPPRLKQPPLLPPLPPALLGKLNYVALIGAAALALLIIFVGAKLFRHQGSPEQTASAESLQAPAQKNAQPAGRGKAQAKSQKSPNAATNQPQQKSAAAQNSVASNKLPASQVSDKRDLKSQPAPAASTAPALTSSPVRSEASSPANVTTVAEKSPSATVAQGEVLDQILPEPSPKAQATIRGKVRVRVKLHVDSSGNVTSADFDSVGPSKYFADLALQAARRWDFAPAKLDGHNVPSDWLVRFEFTQTATKAFPTQAIP